MIKQLKSNIVFCLFVNYKMIKIKLRDLADLISLGPISK